MEARLLDGIVIDLVVTADLTINSVVCNSFRWKMLQ